MVSVVENINWDVLFSLISKDERFSPETLSSLIKRPPDYLSNKRKENGSVDQSDWDLLKTLLGFSDKDVLLESKPAGSLDGFTVKIDGVEAVMDELTQIRQILEEYATRPSEEAADLSQYSNETKAASILSDMIEEDRHNRVKEDAFRKALQDAGIGDRFVLGAISKCGCVRTEYGIGKNLTVWIEQNKKKGDKH